MSHELINHSPDLKRLRDEGFEIEIKKDFLLVHHIPYVNSNRQVAFGTLVTNLNLGGQKTVQPDTHVIFFIGDYPRNKDGTPITAIQHNSADQVLTEGVTVNHSFSNKPPEGYKDYYEKIKRYTEILSAPASSINPEVTATTFKVIECNDPDIPFLYYDTNTSRAEIHPISTKLQNLKIAIVGLGGTGSYILDFVAKTPVKEIHLFDQDLFLQHNAFRAPGAASLEDLRKQQRKVTYLVEIYSRLHKGIVAHEYNITESNIADVCSNDFVFISIDKPEIKKLLIERLLERKIPFIDVGMGVEIVDDCLIGSLRVTVGTKKKHDHITRRIPFADEGNNDYAKNIQIAELNALNAALAVVKWKKLYNFYQDLEHEYNNTYAINVSQLTTDEIAT